jgi:hypothetical protein
MKLNLFKTFTLAGAFLVSGAAFSASAGQRLHVNVPFSFVLAGQEFAPGQYRIDQSDNGLITVQGEGRAAVVLSVPSDSKKTTDISGLSFTSSQDREYLVGVHVEGERARAIPVTAERKLSITSR